MLTFNAFLRGAGIDPRDVRLLRHETRLHGRTPYALWRDDPSRFDDYQRLQKRSRRAWFDLPVWASFVVNPEGSTLFVGCFHAYPEGDVPPDWIDPVSQQEADSLAEYELYTLRPFEILNDEFAGRLVIEWGIGTRTWSQRAIPRGGDRREKRIVELHRKFIEPSFPGHAAFVAQLSDLETLPADWRGALQSVKGVYLLTSPTTHEQYVGSACGNDGFLGRWRNYVADGHGGNIGLKIREPENYRVSILQVAGSNDDQDAILAMEALWKRKLQSREMGLNRN